MAQPMTDPARFEEFMRAYQNMVFSVAVRLLGNETDALDVAQETFLKAHERFDQLQDNPAAGGWLKTVTTNLCLNHLSRYRRRWRFFSELFQPDQPENLDSLLPAPDRQQEVDEEDHRRFHLDKALRKLPAAQRVPLVLYHFEEMSYEEISEKLGVSLSKVKTDIHRGRCSLRRWLKPGFEEGSASPSTDRESSGLDFFGHHCLAGSYVRGG